MCHKIRLFRDNSSNYKDIFSYGVDCTDRYFIMYLNVTLSDVNNVR